jgi:hypothetical protein
VKSSFLEWLLPWLGSIGLMLTCAFSSSAQYPGSPVSSMSSARALSNGFSSAGSYFGGGSTYLPFGGAMGGFVPYSAGPGGGVGVVQGMGESVTPTGSGSMFMLGTRPILGQVRGSLTPLAPIGQGATGSRARASMGSMGGGVINRPASRGATGGMARPPVGSYPFRQPPSLLGPASARPAMSMQ